MESVDTWGIGSSANRGIRAREYALEREASAYIGSLPFVWVGVPDEPGAQSDRGLIESSSIALLSNARKPSVDEPSTTWLGRDSDREVIGTSGLWNVRHVLHQPAPGFLSVLERHILSA